MCFKFGATHVRDMERQMDEQSDETTEMQNRLSEHICLSFDSALDLTVAKNSLETRHLHKLDVRTDGTTDGQTLILLIKRCIPDGRI